MTFNWIEPNKYSFNSFLLMDEYMIRVIVSPNRSKEFIKHFANALVNNPAVLWYFKEKCPDCKDILNGWVNQADKSLTREEIRKSEEIIIDTLDSFIVYLYPEVMDDLDYISGWEKERILSITDFNDKKVLDLGAGTGRLSFAIAPYAKWIYACEPGERLRNYMKNKIEEKKINNIFVSEGTIERIPFADNTFDIVMSGHVMGDNYEQEYIELSRVLKPGGMIIDCPGEDDRIKEGPNKEMLELGFEYSHYKSKFNGDVYRYWKKIMK